MEARWPRLQPSSPSSSASLQPPPLLELTDELWFCSSVISFPCFSFSFSLPSFPFHSRPDTSTLLAQLMFSSTRQEVETPYPCHGYGGYNNNEQIFRPPLPLDDDQCDVDENLHHSMPADCDDDEDYDSCPSHSECTEFTCDGEYAATTAENEACKQELALPASAVSANLKAEDALSGLYDVGVLLKDQQCRGLMGDERGIRREDVVPKEWWKMTHPKVIQVNKKSKHMTHSTHVDGCRDVYATCTVPYVGKSSLINCNAVGKDSLKRLRVPVDRQVTLELSSTEQEEIKEHLKFWAHVVGSALHSKSAQKRQLRDK